MKKKMLLLAIAVLTLATACKKHTVIEPEPNPLDLTMRVGNIYCNDGTTIDPYNYAKAGMTNAVGVIFWVNDSLNVEDKAYIVSRFDSKWNNNTKCYWSDTLIETGVSTSITEMNGAANTTEIISYEEKNGGNFQAKDYAISYYDGDCLNWYLPSAAQLVELYRNKEAVIKALQCCEGEDFDRVWYWTSTEDDDGDESRKYNAFIVTLTEGHIQAESKTNFHAVRPVKTIK